MNPFPMARTIQREASESYTADCRIFDPLPFTNEELIQEAVNRAEQDVAPGYSTEAGAQCCESAKAGSS